MEECKEIIVTCEVCGKEVRAFVKKDRKNFSFICQQCAKKINTT